MSTDDKMKRAARWWNIASWATWLSLWPALTLIHGQTLRAWVVGGIVLAYGICERMLGFCRGRAAKS